MFAGERNYPEAIKSFVASLKIEPTNMIILKDLARVQVQSRDFTAYRVTMQMILEHRVTSPLNWVGYVVSLVLEGELAEAWRVLQAYMRTTKPTEAARATFEQGEVLLMGSLILGRLGDNAARLEHLEAIKDSVSDKLGWKEERAEALQGIPGRSGDALEVWRGLLNRNPDNKRAWEGVRLALGLPARGPVEGDGAAKILAVYDEVAEQFSKAIAPRTQALLVAKDADLRARVRALAKEYAEKGIPSLISNLKALNADPAKRAIVGEELAGLAASFPAGSEARMWALGFLAHHRARAGDVEEALKNIDEALSAAGPASKSPADEIDLLIVKAKVLKRAGAHALAAETTERARQLDKADRFINVLSTKYLFRAGRTLDAEAVVSLFTKDGVEGFSLHDMQAMWYEVASLRAYTRSGDVGRALKRAHAVLGQIEDVIDDMLDFHNYCLRKATVRAYLNGIGNWANTEASRFLGEAARGAVTLYLGLHDLPKKGSQEEADSLFPEIEDPAERKKAVTKLRKAEKKAADDYNQALAKAREARAEHEVAIEKLAAERHAAAGVPKKKKSRPVPKDGADKDPFGAELASGANPLARAKPFLDALNSHHAGNVETHTLTAEVGLRLGKWLRVARALRRAREIAAAPGAAPRDQALAFAISVKVLLALQGRAADPEPVVEAVFQEAIKAAFGGSLPASAAAFIKDSAAALGKGVWASAARAAGHALAKDTAAAEAEVKDAAISARDTTALSAEDACTFLASASKSLAAALAVRCAPAFPMADAFKTKAA